VSSDALYPEKYIPGRSNPTTPVTVEKKLKNPVTAALYDG
jgi:hypothetical protein